MRNCFALIPKFDDVYVVFFVDDGGLKELWFNDCYAVCADVDGFFYGFVVSPYR